MNLCDICGKEANEFEPRFLYWTCAEHAKVPPAYRRAYKKEYSKEEWNEQANAVIKKIMERL